MSDLLERVETLARQAKGLVDQTGGLDEQATLFADLGRSGPFRSAFDRQVGRGWGKPEQGLSCAEVVVGGGLHAAIYAATANAVAGVFPVVFEGRRLGGVMATSLRPVFRLNSRNRAGELGLPGSGGALNRIPNGIVQPADLNNAEYQDNSDFAYAIRASLAMKAQPYRVNVEFIEGPTGSLSGYYLGPSPLGTRTDRVILATGAGAPKALPGDASSELVYSFDSFMEWVGQDVVFPLVGWENVAVVGAGDAGCCVVEALLGQGPGDVGPASLNTIETVTWFGQACETKGDFEEARSRYAGIARFFPRDNPDYYHVITPKFQRANRLEAAPGGVRVIYGERDQMSRVFDHVIVCIGNDNKVDELISSSVDATLARSEWGRYPLRDELIYDSDGTAIARKVYGAEIYKVGPCAELPVTPEERVANPVLDIIPPNSAACFRYARRTQRLAEILHTPKGVGNGQGN